MQFQYWLAGSNINQRIFDCASCKGNNDRKCLHPLYGVEEVEISSFIIIDGKRQSRKIRGLKDVYQYIDEINNYKIQRGEILGDEIEYVLLGQGHNICPIPLFKPLSVELLRMVEVCGDPDPKDYFDLPALYIDGISIINGEKAKIEKRILAKLRAKQNHGKR